jgi:endonuclease YncB( thermonuclease family)
VKDICPNCRTARVGAFRFCLGCRLDFDRLATDPNSSLAAVSTVELVKAGPIAAGTTRAPQLSARGLLAAGLAVVIGLAGSVTQFGPSLPTSAVATATATSGLVAAVSSRPTATSPTATPPAEDLMSGPTGQTIEARVVGVLDGDTIVVAVGTTQYEVRYIGMDSPQTADPSTSVEWIGPQASAANEALVAGKTVVLEKDVSDTDQDGRLLRYVWLTDGVSWTLVNLELVKQGFASVGTSELDAKYVAAYQAAEQKARANGAGLWGAEPTPKPKSTPKPKPTPKPKAPNCRQSSGTVIGSDDVRLHSNRDGPDCA